MRSRFIALGVVCLVGVFAAPACGGSDSAEEDGAGQGGADAGVGGSGGSSATGGSGGASGTGASSGSGGVSGSGGEGGVAGEAGSAGTAGSAGSSGTSGSAGHAGQSGGAGTAGSAGTGQPECGNGVTETPEACDDGDTDPDDGCSAICELEEGWDCGSEDPTTCVPICGDDLLVPTEPCDGDLLGSADCISLGFDGGVLACEACAFDTSACTMCGDGVCDPGELTGCPEDCEAVGISTGENHTCAVGGDGFAWCWGDNTGGKLGDGTADPSLVPVPVDQLTGVVNVAAGFGNHSCAVLDDGTVWCWGENTWGQLGDGGFDDSLAPVQVPGVVGALTVCAGVTHTCALLSSGRVACWGRHDVGQLGNSATHQTCAGGMDCSPSPVFVDYMVSTLQVDCGRYHTCLVKNGGEIFCWGGNDFGQLGVGDTAYRDAPDRVLNIIDGVSVGVGAESACLIRTDGTGWCWGKNDVGQLGNGVPSVYEVAPVPMTGLVDARLFGPGLDHTCVVLDDNSVWCLGSDADEQLGNGMLGDSLALGSVPGLAGSAVIDSGAVHSCAVKHDGTLWCWGGNGSGQLGVNSSDPASAPLQVHLQ